MYYMMMMRYMRIGALTCYRLMSIKMYYRKPEPLKGLILVANLVFILSFLRMNRNQIMSTLNKY